MKRAFIFTLGLATLTALLSACVAPKPAPDPTTVAPAAVETSQALDFATARAKLQNAGSGFIDMVTVSSDTDSDLTALLQALNLTGAARPLSLNSVTRLGQEWLRPSAPLLGAQLGTVVQEVPVRTGTDTISPEGMFTHSDEPKDAWVYDNQMRGHVQRVDWTVNGDATIWVEQVYPFGTVRTEVPTHARGTLSVGGVVRASAEMKLTPGDCVLQSGPTALKVSGWAGKESNPAAKVNAEYAWTATGLTASGSAEYRTKSRKASATFRADVRGTTENRCTSATFAFTPTRADLSASVSMPDHKAEATVALRDLGNLVFSAQEMQAENRYQTIKGRVWASATYNGHVSATAFGPLADGLDLDLQPGDQVAVKYVKGGQLVETNLAALLNSLQR